MAVLLSSVDFDTPNARNASGRGGRTAAFKFYEIPDNLDRRPERLSAVVYLDCSPLPDGMSIADVQSPEQRDLQRAAVEQDGDGWRWPLPDRDTLARGLFGSTAGLQDRHFAAIEQRGTPQPYATFTTPLRLAGARPPGVRRAAIFCTEGGITVAAIRTLLEQGDPRAALFADADWELH